MYKMADYWPWPGAGQAVEKAFIRVNGKNPSLITRTVHAGGSKYQLQDFIVHPNNPALYYIWHLERASDGTVKEWGTDEFEGAMSRLVYQMGKEILWGNTLSIGQTVGQQIGVDLNKSPDQTYGPHNWGWQSITIVNRFPSMTVRGVAYADVIHLRVFQAWCKTWGCDYPNGRSDWNLDYFMAKGLGTIRIVYDNKNPGSAADELFKVRIVPDTSRINLAEIGQ